MTTVYIICRPTLSSSLTFLGKTGYNAFMTISVAVHQLVTVGLAFASLQSSGSEPTDLRSPPRLTKAIPHEFVAAIIVDGPDEQPGHGNSWSALDLAQPLADQAQQFGFLSLLGTKVRGWVDAVASLSLVMDHPHALVLFDIHANSLANGSHRLKDLRAALVTDSAKSNAAIEQRIQHLLTTYTNSTESSLIPSKVKGHDVFTLSDRRWPAWLTFSWGRIGGYYVVGVGEGAYQRIADTLTNHSANLSEDRWFRQALPKVERVSSDFILYVKLDRLRTCLGDSFRLKIDAVLREMHLNRTQRGIISLGLNGRAVEVAGLIYRDGRDEYRALISEALHNTQTRNAIPEKAKRFALVDANLGQALDGLTQAVWAARSTGARRSQEALWAEIDIKSGVSLKQDIYSQLGGPILLHDFPPHPLGLSFAWNMLVPIRGDSKKLRQDLNVWFRTLQDLLATMPGIQLQQSPDGLWYTQFGLVGPAAFVTDQYLVLGFSPDMVRQVANQVMQTP